MPHLFRLFAWGTQLCNVRDDDQGASENTLVSGLGPETHETVRRNGSFVSVPRLSLGGHSRRKDSHASIFPTPTEPRIERLHKTQPQSCFDPSMETRRKQRHKAESDLSTLSWRSMTSMLRGIDPAGISVEFSCTRTRWKSTNFDLSM